MAHKTWNIAIVGPGWAAGAYLEVFRKRDDVRVTHVVSATKQGAQAFVEQHNLDAAVHDRLEDALADPSLDVVGIYTPHHLHASQAIAAANAGKHLISVIVGGTVSALPYAGRADNRQPLADS
ncbi:MAG TPA: Gfo/Idh/MocA family oxidoreductase [Phycisphaerae bacterium]|nr:Gfo/Idh/MocA family oxidoreductase [Phycisphaerae bacterium]HON66426.1 Gfo/Idh/MocA family oxidoreductase [Phycisphaerae bacterium]HPU28674.1 Gfo/Idh/MocA family oxidoreductase [Phycisphaerae bacterium]HQE29978.1 Gfo/Idh/MocA family oxidoreductase [Phycisphaerae bacterium]